MDLEGRTGIGTERKYLGLIDMIFRMQGRLAWSDAFFLSLDMLVFLFTVGLVTHFVGRESIPVKPVELAMIIFCLALGIAVSTYWMTTSMRLQLKLKLRFFQARFMERKLDSAGEFILSDEDRFFDEKVDHLESPDGKEKLVYPHALDGFIGRAKPRQLSLYMPVLFSIMYITIFFWVLALNVLM